MNVELNKTEVKVLDNKVQMEQTLRRTRQQCRQQQQQQQSKQVDKEASCSSKSDNVAEDLDKEEDDMNQIENNLKKKAKDLFEIILNKQPTNQIQISELSDVLQKYFHKYFTEKKCINVEESEKKGSINESTISSVIFSLINNIKGGTTTVEHPVTNPVTTKRKIQTVEQDDKIRKNRIDLHYINEDAYYKKSIIEIKYGKNSSKKIELSSKDAIIQILEQGYAQDNKRAKKQLLGISVYNIKDKKILVHIERSFSRSGKMKQKNDEFDKWSTISTSTDGSFLDKSTDDDVTDVDSDITNDSDATHDEEDE